MKNAAHRGSQTPATVVGTGGTAKRSIHVLTCDGDRTIYKEQIHDRHEWPSTMLYRTAYRLTNSPSCALRQVMRQALLSTQQAV